MAIELPYPLMLNRLESHAPNHCQCCKEAPAGSAIGSAGNFALTLGSRYEQGGAFLDVEAGAGVPLSGAVPRGNAACKSRLPSTLFACDHPAKLSLRSLVGADLPHSDYRFFGTLGYTVSVDNRPTEDGNRNVAGFLGGFAIGAGVQHQTGGGAIFRAEFVGERTSGLRSQPANIAQPSLEDMSVTLSYVMNF